MSLTTYSVEPQTTLRYKIKAMVPADEPPLPGLGPSMFLQPSEICCLSHVQVAIVCSTVWLLLITVSSWPMLQSQSFWPGVSPVAVTTTAAVVVLLLSVLHKNFPYSQVDYTEVGILGLTLKKNVQAFLPAAQRPDLLGPEFIKQVCAENQACVLNCCLPEDFFVLILGLDLMMQVLRNLPSSAGIKGVNHHLPKFLRNAKF